MSLLYAWLAAGPETPLTVVAPWSALLRRVPSRSELRSRVTHLERGLSVDRDALVDVLAPAGYHRTSLVEERGEVGARGGIVDLFPPQLDRPVRIEFDFDAIGSLRRFDPTTQRSEGELDSIVAIPPRAYPAAERRRGAGAGGAATRPRAGPARVADLHGHRGVHAQGAAARRREPRGAAARRRRDHLRLPAAVDARAGRRSRRRAYARARLRRRDVLGPRARARAGPAGVRAALAVHDRRHGLVGAARAQARAARSAGHARPARARRRARRARRGPPRPAPRDRGAARQRPRARAAHAAARDLARAGPARAHHLSDAVGRGAAGRHPVRLRARARGRARARARRLAGSGRDRRRGRAARRRLRAARRRAGRADRAERLRPAPAAPRGPHHAADQRDRAPGADPGGRLPGARRARHRRFGGLVRISVSGFEQEFLLLLYDKADKLYVPVSRLGQVQRYASAEDASPALDRLGGQGWTRTKSRVRRAVQDMAEELLAVVAARETLEGTAFPPPDAAYEEFEARFPFDDTPDQRSATDDVLRDMQKRRPDGPPGVRRRRASARPRSPAAPPTCARCRAARSPSSCPPPCCVSSTSTRSASASPARRSRSRASRA